MKTPEQVQLFCIIKSVTNVKCQVTDMGAGATGDNDVSFFREQYTRRALRGGILGKIWKGTSQCVLMIFSACCV